MKIAGSPHWHPTIQACLLPERRGIVALVRRKSWKKFPRFSRPMGRELIPIAASPGPPGTKIFVATNQFFFPLFRPERRKRELRPQRKARKTPNFFRTAAAVWACDDLLTIPVDNAEGAGL